MDRQLQDLDWLDNEDWSLQADWSLDRTDY